MDNNKSNTSSGSWIKIAFRYAKLLAIPFQGISWLSNKILRPIFALVDRIPFYEKPSYQDKDGKPMPGRWTTFGSWMEKRCYSVGGPSFVAGDFGYIGFAIEKGSNLQLSGSLTTMLAHSVTAFIGDKDPLILKITKPKTETKPKTAFRKAAEWLVNKDRFIVPAVWAALSYNGLSLLIPALLGALKVGLTLASMAFLPQILLGAAVLVGCLSLARFEYLNRTLKKEKDRKAAIEKDAQEIGDLAVKEYLNLHAGNTVKQTEEEKTAIETQAKRSGDLAKDEYLKRTFASSNIPSDEDIACREKSIEDIGKFAFGILGSATMLTIVTAIASGSLSLICISVPAFLLGTYCQYKMTQVQEAAAQRPNTETPQAQAEALII